jgi:cell division protein FtsI (penicillin-binding protein 3)
VAPIQFASAVATLVNGGKRVAPTFLAGTEAPPPEQVVSTATSARIREILRLNVKAPYGTGRRAEVAGYEVGGKTGTAEMPGKGGYQKKAVIASFIAILPSDAPKYLVLVSIFEPKGTEETKGHITAGLNAAPTTGRLIARLAPVLGLLPDARDSQFDVSDAAKYEANRAEVAEGRAP